MEDEELFLVMDDTIDVGKEASPFKDEQEKETYDNLLAKYKKEFGL